MAFLVLRGVRSLYLIHLHRLNRKPVLLPIERERNYFWLPLLAGQQSQHRLWQQPNEDDFLWLN